MKRRSFLTGLGAGAAISTLDWLNWFKRFGVPGTSRELGIANAVAQEMNEPRFLIYWFQEGGWDGYSMFNPVHTQNDATRNIPAGTLNPSPSWSDHRYRPRGYGTSLSGPQTAGNITYGYLAEDGLDLFPDLAVVSSHYGSTFHSGSRFDYHYGRYNRSLSGQRQPNERTVLQAFCEAYGAEYMLPHISWHRWLSDGELSEPSYPLGTGYYEQLGPSHAHTVYGRTPNDLRTRLTSILNQSTDVRGIRIRQFVNRLHDNFIQEHQGASVRAFQSAVEIHRGLLENELRFDPVALFRDPMLRSEFNVMPGDEATSSRSVNGNPARSKETPSTNVQAMMAYELMTNGISNAFWIENREIRAFDSHRDRRYIMSNDGQHDQRNQMNDNLWRPLKALVNRLKSTEYQGTGTSYWDYTTIVLASEMGRTIQGDVSDILASGKSDAAKYNDIMEQDCCQHWGTHSVAFTGGMVQGDRQYGRIGNQTLAPIPMMPDGTLDPAYDPTTGQLRSGQEKSADSFVPDAGHVYSTALDICGLDAARLQSDGKGRNDRAAMTFIKK